MHSAALLKQASKMQVVTAGQSVPGAACTIWLWRVHMSRLFSLMPSKAFPLPFNLSLQIESIKELNSLIRRTQGVMAATKQSYEVAVQARNATGAACSSWHGPTCGCV